jgi:hypothetical protein
MDAEDPREIAFASGVVHAWALDVEHYAKGIEEPVVTKHLTTLRSAPEIERHIADFMADHAQSVLREVHFRDFHLADGSRIEFSWELHTSDPHCIDCGIDACANEYYMVNDALWLQAHPTSKGQLCIGCLERRLGRQLVRTDFADVPINSDPIERSARLNARLNSEE